MNNTTSNNFSTEIRTKILQYIFKNKLQKFGIENKTNIDRHLKLLYDIQEGTKKLNSNNYRNIYNYVRKYPAQNQQMHLMLLDIAPKNIINQYRQFETKLNKYSNMIEILENVKKLFRHYQQQMTHSNKNLVFEINNNEFINHAINKEYDETIRILNEQTNNNNMTTKFIPIVLSNQMKKTNTKQNIINRLTKEKQHLNFLQSLLQVEQKNTLRNMKTLKKEILEKCQKTTCNQYNKFSMAMLQQKLNQFGKSPNTLIINNVKKLIKYPTTKNKVKENFGLNSNTEYNTKINSLIKYLNQIEKTQTEIKKLECQIMNGNKNMFKCENKSGLLNSKLNTHKCTPIPNSPFYTCDGKKQKEVQINIK